MDGKSREEKFKSTTGVPQVSWFLLRFVASEKHSAIGNTDVVKLHSINVLWDP
jgi:hypothetical protein